MSLWLQWIGLAASLVALVCGILAWRTADRTVKWVYQMLQQPKGGPPCVGPAGYNPPF